jgi:glutamyl-tRNA synthetase
MKKEIEKFALQNAIKFKGKANPGAIIGQLFQIDPNLKEKAKELSKDISEIVKEVNKLSLEEQTARLQKIAPELLEKKEKKKRELPELEHVKGTVITRIPPEPSKYPHIGHALSFLINFMYTQKYKGKCVLRLDDTNPEKAKKEYYQAVYDGLLWLGIKVDKTIIASNEMDQFYHHAEKLIENEQAYVCFCDREKMSHYRTNSMICEHREQNARQTMEHWKELFTEKIKQGEAVLRLKADMDSLNAVMRDPVLFRISEHEHPMQGKKYRVWPMYDFETAIAEEFSGVTHILRSSEFGKMRVELQDYIKDLLGFKKQEVKQYGRFNVVGAVTKGREIRAMIEKGEVEGWDDPRLVTLMALKRRGIVPETMYDLVLEAGMSSNATNIDWSVIASINRKIIDPITKRYLFVENPKIIEVENSLKEIVIPLHPDNKELGSKKVETGEKFYVGDKIEPDKHYRFMHLFNFINKKYESTEYDPQLKAKIIHCVPAKNSVDVKVLMNDGTILEGKGEKSLNNLEEGEIVQFERRFFCRLDNKKEMLFVYAHD